MTRRTPFRTCILSAALLLSIAAVTGCKTTVVERVPAPDHHDDHHPPPPPPDHRDDRPDRR